MTAAIAGVELARIERVLAALDGPGHDWLSPSEQARLAGLRHAPRRNQYLAGHWLARVLLARTFGGEPSQWPLLERRGLPPAVVAQGNVLWLSISHTDEWVAVAVATVAIGIDLEQAPRRLDVAVQPLLLNAGEAPGSLDADALMQRWVAKEAWIKRTAGAALPARLQALQLLPAAPERADICIHSLPAFHLALAIDPGVPVQWHGEAVGAVVAAFRVDEDGKSSSAA